MLSFLRIKNLAIVKDLDLEWGEGLNLLTGETGAGKSILVDALGLALGDRADTGLVRAGETRAEIEAVFDLTEDAASVRAGLEEAGLAPEGDQVIVRREIGEGGARSRQFLCDAPVSLATLRRFGDLMVEIQGQHQHHALLSAETQRDALDRFAGAEAERRAVAEAAAAAAEASSQVEALEARLSRGAESQLDWLAFQIGEIEALGPSEADEAALRIERARLAQASRRRELADSVYRALYEEEPSILGALGRSSGELERLAELDPASEPLAARFSQAREILQDAALEVRDFREEAEPDPGRLEEVEARLASYERLARKHRVEPGALGAALEALREEAGSLEDGEGRLRAAREEASRRAQAWLAAARALSARRHAASRRLSETLAAELRGLAMAESAVEVAVETEEWREGSPCRAHGTDRVELRLAPNPGEPPRPLADIASGGELSRAMLAVNAALGGKRRRRTLIFDEVDAGIGGRAAAVVGEKLRSLARTHQVIVVTHLPQVASLADRHFVVRKKVEKGRTIALVHELDAEGRVREIARMMGGKDVTPLARRHAADMLRRSGGRSARRSP
jgi:DNA repair protein RecN (Recombination protein N)